MIFDEDIRESLTILKNGSVILYPTDTIWGLGCDATNASAVEKIFRIKSRIETKSLLILVNNLQMVDRYVAEIPEIVYELTEVFGIRICNEDFCNELITRFRKPIVSTSANFSGKPSPKIFGDIDKELINSVDYVVKYRQDDRQASSASPVIKIDVNGTFKIIRH